MLAPNSMPSLTHEDASAQPSGGMPDTDPRSEGASSPSDDPEISGARERVTARLLDEPGGTRIGRFTILSHLGRGGMGVVWAAYDPSLDRRVALKVLHSRRERDEVHARIVREAQAMAKLSHPNVAQVFEVGEARGATYVAMEYIRGQTLRQWQRGGERTTAQVLDVYLQAAAGLAAAHAAGLIHRDFKPDNAMVGDDPHSAHAAGRVRVLDFGLARIDRDAHDAATDERGDTPPQETPTVAVTRDGAVMGTPSYMAPEQLLGERVDARADQFSFCVALWEALVGERPFGSGHGHELVAAVTSGALRPVPRDVRVPAPVLAALRRGLSCDPADRFADMDALRAALVDTPARRPRTVWVAGAAVVVLGAGLGTWQLDRQRRVQGCADEAASIAASWGEPSRVAVDAALLGTGLVHAEATSQRVAATLDDWTTRWSTARGETCIAAEVDRTLAADDAGRATACLRERRASLEALVGVLVEADATVGHAAASAAHALPDPSACADLEHLRRFPVGDDATAHGAATLRVRLAASEGLNVVARHAAALELAQEVVVAAQSAELPEVEALAHVRAGEALDHLAEYPRARDEYQLALGLAMRAHHDDIALLAMTRMIAALGSLGEIDHALWYGDLATAMLARVDDGDQLREAAVLTAMAVARLERRDFATDRALLERALAIHERALGPDHPSVATSLTNLGSVLLGQGELSAAEAVQQRALAIRERTLGPDHPQVAKSLNNHGSVLSLLGDRDRARREMLRALSVYERAYGPDHPELTQTLDNLAYVHYVEGDFDGAKPLVERSLSILRRVHGEQPTVAHSTANLARLYLSTGDFDRAEVLLRDAIRMLTTSLGVDHFSTASAVAGLAEVARGRGDHRGAAEQFERALTLYLERGTDQRWIAETRFDLALSLWAAGSDRDRAVALAREAVAGYRTADGADPTLLASFEQWVAEHEPAAINPKD